MTKQLLNHSNIARFGQDMVQNEDILCTKSQTFESLRECLAAVEPVQLKGMALLKECRPAGQFFPTGLPREVITEPVQEIITYTARCQRAAEQLFRLTPIPLTTFSILEYGL